MKARFLEGMLARVASGLVLIAFAIIIPISLHAQQSYSGAAAVGRWTFGGYGALNLNFHTANFQALKDIPTGPARDTAMFGNSNGVGFSVGAFAEMQVSELIALQVRLGYSTHGATLTAREPLRVGALTQNGLGIQFFDGIFERRLTADLGLLAIEPMAVITPIESLRDVRFYAGVRAGLMFTRSFSQIETIVNPNDPTAQFRLADGSLSMNRNPQSGAIPDAATLNLALTVGVGYNIHLGSLGITPEVFYAQSLTPVASGLAWNFGSLRAGVALRYEPEIQTPPADVPKDTSSTPPIATNTTTKDSSSTTNPSEESGKDSSTSTGRPPVQHTPPTFQNSEINPQNTLSASIAALAVDENGIEQPLIQLKVEQYVAQQMYPLMNYIFFEQGAGDLQEKYRRINTADTADYDEQKFYNTNMLKIYYDILNVIGKRLKKFPKAKITLTGCNNNVGTEVGNIPLSFRRANIVKRYWIDTWGVDSTRIAIRARNLPEKPTMSRDSLGIEENRRVEFTSDSWEIMKPVLVNDTIGIPMTPLVRFKMNAKADNGIAQSKLDVYQGTRTLKTFTVPGKPDDILDWSPVLDWETASDQSAVPKTEDELKFTFEVTDNKGEKVRPTGSIPVEQITVAKKKEAGTKDKEVAIFRLILFDFNSPAVGPTNGTIVKQFVLPKLKPGTKIQVTGFTDKLGNPDVNMRLSGARAKSVADYIKWPNTAWKGVGGTRPIYPNDTPEGRIYSRSVEVRCEIPLDGN
jgi:outer membrane protein OmpA-like peptidoglycan-associated protein